MYIEFLTPDVFDALVIVSLIVGAAIAGRRFFKDIRKPLPDDAPDWARSDSDSSTERSSADDS